MWVNACPNNSSKIFQVFGLADIYLSEVLVTRDQTLYDLKMKVQFRWMGISMITC